MRKNLFLAMLGIALTANAQTLESFTNYPTGYVNTSYYTSTNTMKTIDGVLYMIYDNVPVVLVRYPAMNEREEFEVPSTVRRICHNAFQGTQFLKTLKIHSTVSFGNFISMAIADTAFNDSSIENFVVMENDATSAAGLPEAPLPRTETGRYDVSGRTTSPSSTGVQIVTYDDHTSQKVVVK